MLHCLSSNTYSLLTPNRKKVDGVRVLRHGSFLTALRNNKEYGWLEYASFALDRIMAILATGATYISIALYRAGKNNQKNESFFL